MNAGSVPAGNMVYHGNGIFIANPSFGANSQVVTLVTPGFVYSWKGSASSDYNTAANWTDVADGTHHAVPLAADSIIVTGGTNATVMSEAHTVANMTVSVGFITLNATLTYAGTYTQESGFPAFGSKANQLLIA